MVYSGIKQIYAFLLLPVILILTQTQVYSRDLPSEQVDRIISLDSRDPVLSRLRNEIADNLKSTHRGKGLLHPLRVVHYKLKEKDQFYSVMARLSQDEDTLASWNRLANPNALGPGDEIRIPNARGLYIHLRESERDPVSKKDPLVKIPLEGAVFIPGKKYSYKEKEMFRGKGFIFPMKGGRISSQFGFRRDPFSHRSAFHGGVDIAAPTGTPVFATRDGVVVKAGRQGAYGNLVIVEHEFGYETYYGHLSRILVKTGDRVEKGFRIGLVGSTGKSTGPHLHFEVRKDGVRKQPHLARR